MVAMVSVLFSGNIALGQSDSPASAINDGAPVENSVIPGAGNAGDSMSESAASIMDRAAMAGKYTFLFFYRADDEPTRAAHMAFDAGMKALEDRADSADVNVTDVRERTLVAKYGLSRAPMPLVLAMGPSGAVTRSFTTNFDEQQLRAAFVSPGAEKSLKALQDRKYVLLCVQNAETEFNDQALQGVREFVADPRYARSVEVVTVDPSDANEVDFLTMFGLGESHPEAVTVLLAPPGKVMGTFVGATDKNTIVAAATPPKGGGCCGGGTSTCGGNKPANSQPQTPSGVAVKKP